MDIKKYITADTVALTIMVLLVLSAIIAIGMVVSGTLYVRTEKIDFVRDNESTQKNINQINLMYYAQ